MKFFPTVCGSVAGNPSPLGVRMHNAGYLARDLPFTYLAVGSDDIDEVLDLASKLHMRGLGVSMPHKQSVIDRLDHVTDAVRGIGACNTVVFNEEGLTGYNTDWVGACEAMAEAGIDPRIAEIVGAGGVARALAYCLKQNGAAVHVLARRSEQAQELVEGLGLNGYGSIESQGTRNADLVVNATPDSGPASPVKLDNHSSATALFDVAFQQLTTPLAAEAQSRGLKVAPGWRMLLHQGCEQFKLYTGVEAPVDEMAHVLEKALG